MIGHGEDVGPVLTKSAIADAVVAAIFDLNPDARLLDRGSYVRVSAAGRCELTREAVEAHLGAPFELPSDLESVMMSFTGELIVSEHGVLWVAKA